MLCKQSQQRLNWKMFNWEAEYRYVGNSIKTLFYFD